MSGLVLKGALVEFMPTFLPVPGAERDRLPVQPRDDDAHLDPAGDSPAAEHRQGTEASNPLAVKGMPGEEFSFTIAMDANDEIANGSAPGGGARRRSSGIYSRLAALEMLLYPTGTARPGCWVRCRRRSSSALTGAGRRRHSVRSRSPCCRSTLFIWGAGPDRARSG